MKIKKYLMRGRGSYLFGRRAWYTVRIPLWFCPPPVMPGILTTANKGDFQGFYHMGSTRKDDNWFNVGRLSGPSMTVEERIKENVFHYQEREPHLHNDGRLIRVADFWEFRCAPQLESTFSQEDRQAIVDYEIGMDEWREEIAVKLTPFHDAMMWSKTWQSNAEGPWVYITFVVKYFYPSHKYGFCSGMRRGVKGMAKMGVRVWRA